MIIFYVTRQKIRYKKSLAEALNRFEKQPEERKRKPFLLETDPEKNSRAVSFGS